MPANAIRVPAIWFHRSRSAPSTRRIRSVKSGWLVSTTAEENAVDRCMPQNTIPMCSVWPMSAQARKRGQSSRLGSVAPIRCRNTTSSSRSTSTGMVMKRMKRNGPTPSASSTYFTNAKFTPHRNIVTSAAMSAQREWFKSFLATLACPLTVTQMTDLSARAAVRELAASKIRELYNEGIGRRDILAFWVGEPDEPTPDFIRKAATDSIAAGELFYTHNLGIAELREALAAYTTRLHRKTGAEQIAVTSAGVNALMLASQLLVDPGDRVVEVVPLWPNLQEIPKILGAQVTTVALDFSPEGWTLDVQRLIHELKPGTRALYLNSPNNPTGWTVTREEQKALLGHCRRHGIWIFADDAYERLYFGAGAVAPSFLDVMDDGDRVISTNTFSKSWLMTGWRLGWLVVPPGLAADLGKLIEYNTSCTPVFVQRAGIAAVTGGEAVIARSLERFRQARDFLVQELRRIPDVEVAVPDGTMYAFFRVRGMTDSLAFCKRLVREQGLGLAPGSAFGPEGEGYVRWCFAAELDKLADGVRRLRRA